MYFVIASSNTLASRVRQNKRALHPNFFRCEACKNWMRLFLLELVRQSASHCINFKISLHTKRSSIRQIYINFFCNKYEHGSLQVSFLSYKISFLDNSDMSGFKFESIMSRISWHSIGRTYIYCAHSATNLIFLE